VPVILIDANIEGHGAHIWTRMQSAPWNELTTALDVTFRTFSDVGLDRASPDDVVWYFCQGHGYYLLTSNRNQDAEDSLEAVIKLDGIATSLPVITLPSPDRVFHSAAYLERVIEKLLDFMLYADNIRGAGRVYVP